MSIFLFLYPIRPYFTRQNLFTSAATTRQMEILNGIIDVRYRLPGYRICWLMFGEDHDSRVPDFWLWDSRVVLHGNDKVISSGMSYEKHTSEKLYPREDFILQSLPVFDNLVLGGFHRIDCVDRLASAVHKQRIPVSVDEDTTDQMFQLTRMGLTTPLFRTREDFAQSLLTFLCDPNCTFPAGTVEEHRKERATRPWLVQI